MTQAQKPPFPQVGEVFELTASEEITGLGLVEAFGYNPERWQSSAKSVPVDTTRRFKLLHNVGYQENLDAITRVCKAQGGKDTSGCWIKVFNETFGGHEKVAVADLSWVNPDGCAGFPVVSDVHRYFERAVYDNVGLWFILWLVEVDEEKK